MRRSQIVAREHTLNRTVNLAVEVSWRISACTPSIATAKVDVWVPSILAPDSYLVGVAVPEQGLRLACTPSDLPRGLRRKILASGTSFSGHGHQGRWSKGPTQCDREILNFAFPVLVCRQKEPPFRFKGDALVARNAFLRLPQEISALSDFLSTYGTWSVGSTRNITLDNPQSTPAQSNISVVEPELFWRQQRELRQAMGKSASSWISRNQPKLQLSSRDEFPHFFHEDSTCLEAITNSFTVDFMRGVRIMCCQRADCQNIFEASHKGKRFCSQYCGHLTSVRRNRAAAKKGRTRKRKTNGAL